MTTPHTPNGFDPRWVEIINDVLLDRESGIRLTDINQSLWDRFIGPLVDEVINNSALYDTAPRLAGIVDVVPPSKLSLQLEGVFEAAGIPSALYRGQVFHLLREAGTSEEEALSMLQVYAPLLASYERQPLSALKAAVNITALRRLSND